MKRKLAQFWVLLKDTSSEWSTDRVPRLGAALAYYTVFSIVPLLVIIIAMIGLVFGEEAAQSYIIEQIKSLVGGPSAEALKDMIERANKPSTGLFATIVAVVTLLLGSSGLFGQLQDALNSIWDVEPKGGRGIWGMIKDRFLSFLAVLGTGFLLLVSLVLSAGLAAIGKLFGTWLPGHEIVLQILELLLSFAVITGLFAMMFKLLPDAKIAWSDVWVGAVMTSLLFTVGKFVIGLYLGKSDVGSTYGAAGSLVIILVWVYYSSQILLFGAEFTQVHAKRFGSRIVPTENAVAVDQENDRKPSGVRKPTTTPSETMVTEAFQDAPGRRVASRYPDRTFSRQDRWIGLFLLLLYGVELLRRKKPQNEAHGLPR